MEANGFDDYDIETDDELLMHNYNTLPPNVKKYWKRRYDLFTRFDEGILMISELWYSVTPEAVAVFTAKLVTELLPSASNILDVCCGGGGNTVQFANFFETVGGVDIKLSNVRCTRNNARVYGVDDKIWTYVSDWNECSRDLEDGSVNQTWIPKSLQNFDNPNKTFDFIFCSPPWGGPSYPKKSNSYTLDLIKPFSIKGTGLQFLKYTENFGMFLPKSLNIDQLKYSALRLFGDSGKCKVVYVKQNNHCVGLIAFFGPDVTHFHKGIINILESSDCYETYK